MTELHTMNKDLLKIGAKNIHDIVYSSLCLESNEKCLVIYDTEYELTQTLAECYRIAVPNAHFVDFAKHSKEEIITLFDTLSQGDLVVLVQSTNFRLNDFRIRLHLFEKGLKVIEHVHLIRNSEQNFETYIHSLEYDKTYLHDTSTVLGKDLDDSESLLFVSNGEKLVVSGKLEKAKYNVGDYSEMKNKGGTFPIGEVMTEAQDFASMSGSVYIYAFADSNFHIHMYDPFKIDIHQGEIIGFGENTPQEFKDILSMVKMYERPLIREIGFGLNKAISKNNYVEDVTAFERILGVHFSLGEKHSVYKKEGITTNKTKFHIDIFPCIDRVQTDTHLIFDGYKYVHTAL